MNSVVKRDSACSVRSRRGLEFVGLGVQLGLVDPQFLGQRRQLQLVAPDRAPRRVRCRRRASRRAVRRAGRRRLR
ncbi:MAG: hypothetical protein MZW92_14450 [Comamonadaceae bacterium]|nr:hypothetical protein [Comamonadaceae bacterium]